VGAESLRAFAAAIEHAGAGGDVERCAAWLPRMEEEFERFSSALADSGWLT
jgi:hypothetical protein